MKWVAQVPNPLEIATKASHINRLRPCVARQRSNMLTPTIDTNRQMAAATATRRRSCSVVRQA